MTDSENNVYDLFGNVLEGPDKGSRLPTANGFRASTFAWQLLFDDIRIFKTD